MRDPWIPRLFISHLTAIALVGLGVSVASPADKHPSKEAVPPWLWLHCDVEDNSRYDGAWHPIKTEVYVVIALEEKRVALGHSAETYDNWHEGKELDWRDADIDNDEVRWKEGSGAADKPISYRIDRLSLEIHGSLIGSDYGFTSTGTCRKVPPPRRGASQFARVRLQCSPLMSCSDLPQQVMCCA
jgi:hypothetical protein